MTEKNYVVNVKTTLGTIITVRADTADELAENITAMATSGLNDHVGALEELFLGAKAQVSSAVNTVVEALGATIVGEQKFSPKAPPSAPVAGGKTCVHGAMVRRTGNGAKGEWRGFFCPTPKGTEGQCSPAFVNRGSAEWQSF
jgi:hypothetical protein